MSDRSKTGKIRIKATHAFTLKWSQKLNLLLLLSLRMFFVDLQKSFAGANKINRLFIETHTHTHKSHNSIYEKEREMILLQSINVCMQHCERSEPTEMIEMNFLCDNSGISLATENARAWQRRRKNLNYEYEFPLIHSCFWYQKQFPRALRIYSYCCYCYYIVLRI